jgi:environmental stress-induced protein Ves
VRKLDARSYTTMPWKNGGGTTTEVARSPETGSLEDFDWRVSMANVDSAGPFSRFAGVDRSIAILEGDGVTLWLEGRGTTTLDRESAPFVFPADISVSATLAGGPVEDLNVMTRRGRFRHLLTRARFGEAVALAPLGDVAILVVVQGSAEARVGSERPQLALRDALVLGRGEEVALSPRSEIELFAIDLWRCT